VKEASSGEPLIGAVVFTEDLSAGVSTNNYGFYSLQVERKAQVIKCSYAGYVTARCLKKLYGIECQVKWPNDVLVSGAKIAGIYCECIDSYISCGIGINLLQKEFDPSYRRKACSVNSVTGLSPDREELLKEMVKEFILNLKNLQWIKDFQTILYKNNQNITVLDGLADTGTVVSGILTGIGEYGQMLIRTQDGTVKEIFTGEIQ